MSIKDRLGQLLNDLPEEDLLPYIYTKAGDFIPGKSSVYYSGPFWDDEEPLAAMKSLMTGKWLSSGEEVARFEREFSKKFNFNGSIMVNSGSSANLVMLAGVKKHLGWEDNAEVIVSPVGFPTTIAPLIQVGLKPVFVDIKMEDLNFDLEEVEKTIGPKTKAVLLSPVLGNPPNVKKLKELCESRDITFLLDGCDSLGSKWKDKHLSDYAYATSCSFYPAHHITTGEGGMVSSQDEDYLKTARRFAWWGRDCYCVGKTNLSPKGACGDRFSKWIESYDGIIDHKYLFTEMGYNLKPLDLQGSIGLVQLKKFETIHQRRRDHKDKMASLFKKHLGDTVNVLEELPDAETSWFGTAIICGPNKLKETLVKFLEENKIQTRNYFAGNILMHPGYQHLANAKDFPQSNRVLDQVFFVGCNPSYTDPVFDYVDSVLEDFSKQHLKDFR